ncbi:MAG: AsmA-like C-terminal domain-containing protein, partial [Alphaproteobacteria bacterium]
DEVTGMARIGFRAAFPLLKDMLLEDVEVVAIANLEDVALVAADDRPAISGGLLRLTLDNNGMDVNGALALNGVPGDGVWRENFTADAPFVRRYTFSGRFTDSQRLALGLPDGDYVTGPSDMGIEIVDLPDGNRQWRITADLVSTMVRIPEIYWQKPAGVEGSITLDFLGGPKILQTAGSFDLAAGDLTAQGRAGIDAETLDLAWLELDSLVFGENDVRAALLFDMGGGYRIGVEGPSLDLRPYLDDYDSDRPLPELRLSADVDRVITRDGQSFHAVKAELLFSGGRWEAMNVDGLLAGDKHLAVRIDRDDSGRTFFMGSDDGGELLRALDIFDDAIGGTLTVDARFDPTKVDGPIAGELKVDNFKVVNAPLLARILSVASLIGVFDLLKGEGLPFSDLVVPFVMRGDVLEIDDAYAKGPAIGFTFKGQVDLAADHANLEGTIVPAYVLNSFLGNFPILKDLFVPEEGGGVFAMTYTLVGPLDDPVVKVNPLPALAPGILRNLFRFDDSLPTVDEVEPSEDVER